MQAWIAARSGLAGTNCSACSLWGIRELSAMNDSARGERLQIILTAKEQSLLDSWRFDRRMPSQAAAIRELLKRGLAAEGFDFADDGR
jgi:hypothetical protein